MVRPETKPDDVHGLLAAEGIRDLVWAAVPATPLSLPASSASRLSSVSSALRSSMSTIAARTMTIDEQVSAREGDWVSIDGTTRRGIRLGTAAETLVPNHCKNPVPA